MAIQEHLQQLSRGADHVRQWQAEHPGVTLDFSGADLSGNDLNGYYLPDANFTRCTLTNAKLNSAILPRAKFHGCLMENVELHLADLTDAELMGANLTGAKLENATLTRTDLTGANLPRATLPIPGFAKAKLLQVNFQYCIFDGAVLPEISFVKADLSYASFVNAKLAGAHFDGSNLTGANFERATLPGAFFIGCQLSNIKFPSANLSNCNFERAFLTAADLSGAQIFGADFHESTIDRAIFKQVRGATLALHLGTTQAHPDARYFDQVELNFFDGRHCDWERARVFGRLPLFTASYTALIAIPFVAYGYSIYNDAVQSLRDRAERAISGPDDSYRVVARAVLDNAHFVRMPAWSLELLLATALLAIASTIYALRCPSRRTHFAGRLESARHRDPVAW